MDTCVGSRHITTSMCAERPRNFGPFRGKEKRGLFFKTSTRAARSTQPPTQSVIDTLSQEYITKNFVCYTIQSNLSIRIVTYVDLCR